MKHGGDGYACAHDDSSQGSSTMPLSSELRLRRRTSDGNCRCVDCDEGLDDDDESISGRPESRSLSSLQFMSDPDNVREAHTD